MAIDEKTLSNFYYDFQVHLGCLAEKDAQQLWLDCEHIQQPISNRFDPITWSVFNRMQQETYYKALDTFMNALKLTLFKSDATEEEEV